MQKKYDKLVMIYFAILIIYLQISNILYCYRHIDSTFVSTGLVIIGIVGFVIYILNKIINKSLRTHDIFVIMMVIFGIISWKCAFVKRVALLGFKSGREGLYVLITYYIVFLLGTTLKDKKYQKNILIILTVMGLINVLYSYLQIPGKEEILSMQIANIYGYPSGFLSNSNFFGSYMVLLNGIWISHYLFSNKEKIDYIALIISILFLSGLLLSGAMSAIVGLISMIIVTIIIFIYKGKIDKTISKKIFITRYILLIVSFSILYLIISCSTNVNLNDDIKEMGNQAVSTVTTGIDENFGTGRIHIWKEALYYFNKYNYWNTGIGIDNFYYIGHGHIIIDTVSGDQVYKAHNEYLQILVTEGIYMLITYLAFLFFIFIKGVIYIIKNKRNDVIFTSLFTAFIGYSVQAFFNISMTRVAPLYFLICGFVCNYSDKIFEKQSIKIKSKSGK